MYLGELKYIFLKLLMRTRVAGNVGVSDMEAY